jgi:hypothetical protein
MRLSTVASPAFLAAWPNAASAQFFTTCRDGSVTEFSGNVRAHAEHNE